MRTNIIAAITLMLVSALAFAQGNGKLEQMFVDDQAARQGGRTDGEQIAKEDAGRRSAVLELLSRGEIRTAMDYYNAAMIMQHGGTTEEIRLAHAFATISSALSDSSDSKWLKAASWDRLMLRLEQPQWYGTQFTRGSRGEWELYQLHPDAVSDKDCAAWSVPSIEEARARVQSMNTSR